MGSDFVDYQHDSANFKQVWFALAAMAVLLFFVRAAVGGGKPSNELQVTVAKEKGLL